MSGLLCSLLQVSYGWLARFVPVFARQFARMLASGTAMHPPVHPPTSPPARDSAARTHETALRGQTSGVIFVAIEVAAATLTRTAAKPTVQQ